jgi:uncharacterized DUF497 family protein
LALLFEWDEDKARQNEQKHGVAFSEAATVFGDLVSLTIFDPLHSDNEDRYVTIGVSHQMRLLVVVHTDRDDRIRIISARTATRAEREQYEQ